MNEPIPESFRKLFEQESKKAERPLYTFDDYYNRPPPQWLVKGLILKESHSLMLGLPKGGKTFSALDLLLSTAGGAETWFNGDIKKHGHVVYVLMEYKASLPIRIHAYRKYHDISEEDFRHTVLPNFHVLVEPINLIKSELEIPNVDHLIASIEKITKDPVLIVVDTVNRAIGGADENSSTDMGLYVDAASKLRDTLHTNVLSVHHPGKDVSKGARGHSSLPAAVDSTFYVQKETDNQRSLHLEEVRDGAEAKFNFELMVVPTGLYDEDGVEWTSCAVNMLQGQVPSHRKTAKEPKPKAMPDHEIYMNILYRWWVNEWQKQPLHVSKLRDNQAEILSTYESAGVSGRALLRVFTHYARNNNLLEEGILHNGYMGYLLRPIKGWEETTNT